MKTNACFMVAALSVALLSPDVLGQYRSARDYTKRIVPPTPPRNSLVGPAAPAQRAPAPAAAQPKPAVAKPVVVPATPVDPEKAEAARQETQRKTLEFQKKRAEDGSASAQYDLGMRYLKGDSLVEQNAEEGKKWLEKAAQNGNEDAAKKLEELK